MTNIHPTAVIHPAARLAPDVRVAPYVVIEEDVIIKDGCEIDAHAVIKARTSIGKRNRIHEHAILGGTPQDTKFRGEKSALIIGDDNIIREFATLHRASGEGEMTVVGSGNFIMVGVHIAHNCRIGNRNIFANGAALAGHCEIENNVFLSSNVGLHQFTRIGRYAMVGGKSKIVQDVLPYFTTDGNPPRVRGLNSVGLRRAGFSPEARRTLKQAHHLLFRAGLPLDAALAEIEALDDEHAAHLAAFIRGSRRGFTRASKNAMSGRELAPSEHERL